MPKLVLAPICPRNNHYDGLDPLVDPVVKQAHYGTRFGMVSPEVGHVKTDAKNLGGVDLW